MKVSSAMLSALQDIVLICGERTGEACVKRGLATREKNSTGCTYYQRTPKGEKLARAWMTELMTKWQTQDVDAQDAERGL